MKRMVATLLVVMLLVGNVTSCTPREIRELKRTYETTTKNQNSLVAGETTTNGQPINIDALIDNETPYEELITKEIDIHEFIQNYCLDSQFGMPYFNYSIDPDREQLYPTPDALSWLNLQLKQLSALFAGIKLNVFFDSINGDCGSKNKISFCSARSSGLVVHSDGSYGFCANSLDARLRFSHIHKMTLAEAWDSQDLHDFIFPSKERYASTDCGNCKRFYDCLPRRCHVRALRLYNNLWEKDSYCEGVLV